jgi:hypothetical protein
MNVSLFIKINLGLKRTGHFFANFIVNLMIDAVNASETSARRKIPEDSHRIPVRFSDYNFVRISHLTVRATFLIHITFINLIIRTPGENRSYETPYHVISRSTSFSSFTDSNKMTATFSKHPQHVFCPWSDRPRYTLV